MAEQREAEEVMALPGVEVVSLGLSIGVPRKSTGILLKGLKGFV